MRWLIISNYLIKDTRADKDAMQLAPKAESDSFARGMANCQAKYQVKRQAFYNEKAWLV